MTAIAVMGVACATLIAQTLVASSGDKQDSRSSTYLNPSAETLAKVERELNAAATTLYGSDRKHEIRLVRRPSGSTAGTGGAPTGTAGSSNTSSSAADAAQTASQPRTVQYNAASGGDVAAGVILIEKESELYLDISPCTNEPLAFHKPYTKRVIGKVTCRGKEFDRVQVEKQ